RAERRTGLVTYSTIGDPDLPRSAEILRALDRAGADVLEVGVPFSDPLADGPVIQRATERALAAGGSLRSALATIADLRPQIAAPIVVFSYANPLLRMGISEFARQAAAAGVDGALVVGSALVSVIATESGSAHLIPRVEEYVRWLKGAGRTDAAERADGRPVRV